MSVQPDRPLPPADAVLTHVFRLSAGQIVSVYLDTTGSVEDAAQRVRTAWKTLRRELAHQGAEEAALTGVDRYVEGAHAVGNTLVVFATPEDVLYAEHLPPAPDRELARVGPLPHVLPLLAYRQRLLPHVVVATDRLGAELVALLPYREDLAARVVGEELHVTRSAPGGWSQRRYQQRAENRWESNAGAVAEALTRLVDDTNPRLVVVSGDVRAVQFLRAQVPPRVADLLVEVQAEYDDVNAVVEQAAAVIEAAVEQETASLLATFREEIGQQDRAVAGVDRTAGVLRLAAVDTLLLVPEAVEGRTAWFGPELPMAAANPSDLRSYGVPEPVEATLGDVLTRAAVGTGARVRLVPADAAGAPADGVGALLRYPS